LKPPSEDNTHINDVTSGPGGNYVVTGDDFGLVNVFNWPHPQISASVSYAGHSEHVARVVVSPDN